MSAIQEANAEGQLFVTAAGNEGSNNDVYPDFPANFDAGVILAVGATDFTDHVAYYSNYGQKNVDIGAPGDQVCAHLP